MKTFPSLATVLPWIVGSITLTGLSACNKQEQENVSAKVKDAYHESKATVKEAYYDSKAAVAKAWGNVKDYSFDKRDEFGASAKVLAAQMDVKMSELRAEYSEAKASASRKAAMEELKRAEADYKEKTRAVGTATADTWDSAKANLVLSWDRLQAAYYKARAE